MASAPPPPPSQQAPFDAVQVSANVTARITFDKLEADYEYKTAAAQVAAAKSDITKLLDLLKTVSQRDPSQLVRKLQAQIQQAAKATLNIDRELVEQTRVSEIFNGQLQSLQAEYVELLKVSEVLNQLIVINEAWARAQQQIANLGQQQQ